MEISKFLKNHFTKKYHDIYKHAKKLFIFDIILLILAFSIFGSALFWFFWTPSIASDIELTFAYSSEKIVSGQEIEIHINYKNNSKFDLNDTSLSLHFPDGFLLNKEKNTLITDINSIALERIHSGRSGQITIYGQIIGNVIENDKILAILTYKIGNSSKIDQKKELSLIDYSGSYLKAELEIEKTVFPDKEMPFIIKLANLSEDTIDAISLQLPNFFSISQEIPDILLAKQEIALQGIAEIPKTLGQLPFSFSVLREFNGKKFIQQEENLNLNVLSPDISLKLTPQTIYSYLKSGDSLVTEVEFENLSGNVLENQVLVLRDVNNVLDLERTAKLNNLEQNGQDLILDKNFHSVFQNGSKLKSAHFTLTLKLKENAGALSPALDLKAIFSANLFASDLKFSATGDEIEIPITSLLQVEARARYYTKTGDQLGVGFLPPQMNFPIKYWIYINLKNGANELGNFKIIIKPNSKTTFTQKQSVNYGDEMILVNPLSSWQKDVISAFKSFNVYFEVENTPDEKDLGKNIKLIDEIKIEATDLITGKKYEINLGEIDNVLQEDDLGSEFGSAVIR